MGAWEEPLDERLAKRVIREALATGEVRFTRHAQERMEERDLTSVDVVNVLRAGVVSPAELENGTWRYRVQTPRLTVVIAFRGRGSAVVVSAWRRVL